MTYDANTKRQFIAEVRSCLEKAGELFNVPTSRVEVKINVRGTRKAGEAQRRYDNYILRFNPNFIAEYYDEMVSSTIPHEVAHIVCYMRPELGRNHDRGWKKVARALGDHKAGERCHNMNISNDSIAPAPKRAQYLYRTTSGKEITLGAVRHRRVQAGSTYRLRDDYSKIAKEGFVKKVWA